MPLTTMQQEHDSTIPVNVIRAARPGPDGFTPRPAAEVDHFARVGMTSEANFYVGLEGGGPKGLFLPTYRTRPVGTVIGLAIEVPGRDGLIVTSALVRWVREPSDGAGEPPGMGVEFLALSDKARACIQRFARKRAPFFFDLD
jgi:Tfp pilus assembly protein PilZ